MERVIISPMGSIRIRSNGKALCGLEFTQDPGSEGDFQDPILSQAARELAEYFEGNRQVFTVKLDLTGTPFQEKVWEELRKIPYGATISYGELARRVGSPKASRAVGGANGKNQIAIIVPCHRVITSTRRIGGYASGPEHKSFLLDLEQAPYRK